jgi:hypothetical protein
VYRAAVRDPDEQGAIEFLNGFGVAPRACLIALGVALFGLPTFLNGSDTWFDVGWAIALTGFVGALWCTLRIVLARTRVPRMWLVPWDGDLVWQAVVAVLIVQLTTSQ